MRRRLITSNSPYGEKYGYSRAIVGGGFVFVAGTTGYDSDSDSLPMDVEKQCQNAFKTISTALVEAGSSLSKTVRATYFVTNRADIDPVLDIASSYFRTVRPATSLVVVSGLLHKDMKVEIEVTACT